MIRLGPQIVCEVCPLFCQPLPLLPATHHELLPELFLSPPLFIVLFLSYQSMLFTRMLSMSTNPHLIFLCCVLEIGSVWMAVEIEKWNGADGGLIFWFWKTVLLFFPFYMQCMDSSINDYTRTLLENLAFVGRYV